MKILEKIASRIRGGISPDYLADITGSSPDLGLGEYLDKTGVLQSMPGWVQDRYKEAQEAQADGVHRYLCSLETEAARGQKNNCSQSKAWSQYNRDVSAANGPYILEFEIDSFPFRHSKAAGAAYINIPKPRTRAGKELLGVDGRFQRLKRRPKPTRYYYGKIDTTPSKGDSQEVAQFEAAVNGEAGKTIGQRALYYGHNGQVMRGTAAIGREGRAAGLSASTATLNQSRGDGSGAMPTAAPGLSVARQPNKKRPGETTDSGGNIAGLAAVGLIAAAMAALLPMHFVTSAITFLNSMVTFFTTTRSAIATYLSMIDALLGLFGMRGATAGFKGLINGLLDNAFGKENIAYAKAAFASTLNSVATGVKLAEKIQQARAKTDNKIDDLAIGLGTVNNGLKESGLLPPDSPFMAASGNIDQFVADRTSGEEGEALKDNIYQLTSELKTQEETQRELAEEEGRRQKEQAKINKQIDDTARLGAGLQKSFGVENQSQR